MRHLLAIALAALTLSHCTGAEKAPNLLLVSLDTVRADALGPDTTPQLEALAAAGVRVANAISPAPLTLPAHTSMLTGRLPTSHGMRDNLSYELSDSETTLAEMLRSRGYTTGAIVSSFVLDSRFNLDQGFTTYDDTFEEEHKIASLSERKGGETTQKALDWLDEHAAPGHTSPFFLFLHYYDPHDDYAPPEPFASEFSDDPYLGEVAFTDDSVGRVLERLETLGAAESTIVVVVGDHGEMLGEHGELTHGYFVYESALRVPMIVRAPGLEPGVITERASLVDLLPTLAGLLGMELDTPTDGVDLLNEAAARARRELYFESVTPNRYYGLAELHGLVTDRFKYIDAPRPELYDLAKDPDESTNVIEANARIAEGMRESLAARLADSAGARAAAPLALDEEARERLSALGYLGGATAASDAEGEHDGTREDPKDWIGFYRDHQELERLVNAADYEAARALASSLVGRDPNFAAGYLQLARIATETDRLEEAEAHYEKALELDAANAGAHFNLGNILRARNAIRAASEHYEAALAIDPGFDRAREALGNVGALAAGPDERLRHFREAVDRAPSSAEAHHGLGVALRDSGQAEAALREIERSLALAPGLAAAHNDLGVTLKALGREDEAEAHYRQAIALDPGLAAAHNNLGSLVGTSGRLAEALGHFRDAVAADPRHAEAQNNLGMALRMTGARDEAIPHFRAALSARPDWPAPLNELAWILATHPDPAERSAAEAVQMAERAVELTQRRQPVYLDTLAAAYAATGEFARAIETGQLAVSIASARAPRLGAEMGARVALYRQGRAFVEPARIRAAPR